MFTAIRNASLIAAVCCGALSLPTKAQTIDCANAGTTVEMNFCADRDYQAADKALNDAYQMALKSARSRDMEPPYDAKSFEGAVIGAQRAWLSYRDADCKGVVAQIWTNGTGAASAILQCMTAVTMQRTKELNEQFQDH